MDYSNIIIDSSVWIALFNKEDNCHVKATQMGFRDLYLEEQTMPDIVFYETITVLKNKKNTPAAN